MTVKLLIYSFNSGWWAGQRACYHVAPSIGSVRKYTLLTLTFIVSRHFLWPGQEAHEGVVWCTGSSAELLQLHSSRIKRNVPQILHTLPAFQSPEVPSSLGGIYNNCDLFWTLNCKLRFFLLCKISEYLRIFCNFLEPIWVMTWSWEPAEQLDLLLELYEGERSKSSAA